MIRVRFESVEIDQVKPSQVSRGAIISGCRTRDSRVACIVDKTGVDETPGRTGDETSCRWEAKWRADGGMTKLEIEDANAAACEVAGPMSRTYKLRVMRDTRLVRTRTRVSVTGRGTASKQQRDGG